MSLDAAALYALLPAVYRTRDAAGGGQLQALFAVMAAQSAVVEDDINQLYDDQFIETCAPWVIPYLADLIGYNSIYEVAVGGPGRRAEVANTIGYRQRKGTLLALEQVTADISGRATLAAERFRRLITTESMRLVEPGYDATVSMRDGRALDLLGTAFDVTNRTIDVRRIAPRARVVADPDTAPLDIALHGPGRSNIPDVAVHLWRWQSWTVTDATAVVVGGGRYRFSQLGHDMPIFSSPPARAAFTSLTTRADIPLPIGRRELAHHYGPKASVLLTADGAPVDVSQVYGANLADRPGGSWCAVAYGKIAIDPELGRIQYGPGITPPQLLEVSYNYGFPASMGGGGYDRSASLTQFDPGDAGYRAIVGSFPDLAGAIPSWTSFDDLPAAVAGWNDWSDRQADAKGVIVLPGFESLTADLTGEAAVLLPAGSSLALVAGQPLPAIHPSEVTWTTSRVTITGDIEVEGVAGSASAGQFLINGIWLAGELQVNATGSVIQVADSTLVPGLGLLPDGEPLSPGDSSILVTAQGASVSLNRVISGPVAAHPSGTTRICDSIIDATSPYYVAYGGEDLASAGADLHIEDSTVIGKVRTRTFILASGCIFHARLGRRDPWPAAVWASRQQAGCVRFCVLPFGSITPRRYRCLPPTAASEPALEPSFVTLRYGQPGYALLSGDVPMAIWTGADNGSQLGAYLQIRETEAVSNVQLRAPEYLPALLESGIFIHPARHAEPPVVPTAYGYYPRRYDRPADAPGIGAGLI